MAKRAKRITMRKTDGGYRNSNRRTTFANHADAFDAAWKDCARLEADLYAMKPDGERVPLLGAKKIRKYEASH